MRHFLIMSALMFMPLLSMAGMAAEYDVVILNGRVMDPETNFDAVRNVGIKDGKIVTITESAITGINYKYRLMA